MKFTTTAPDRRTLVRAIAQHTNTTPEYVGPPSFAYRAGDVTIDRDGEVDVPDEQAADLKAFLVSRGWMEAEPEPEPEIDILQIGMPDKGITAQHMTNLIHMLYSKQDLLAKAQGGCHCIRVEDAAITRLREYTPNNLEAYAELLRDFKAQGVLDGIALEDCQLRMDFPMPENGDSTLWLVLMTRMVATAQSAHWVFPQRLQPENEKYYMRGWLLRLGMGGTDFKAVRHALLKNLNGCTAFPDATKAQQHKERWQNIRRERRQQQIEPNEQAQEVCTDEKPVA